jgi:hypothetical protein
VVSGANAFGDEPGILSAYVEGGITVFTRSIKRRLMNEAGFRCCGVGRTRVLHARTRLSRSLQVSYYPALAGTPTTRIEILVYEDLDTPALQGKAVST